MTATGFTDAPRQSARAFRAALTALSRPGTIVEVAPLTPPAGLSIAAATLILTLCDRTAGLWLGPGADSPETREWIAFQTAAPLVAPEQAAFALGRWDELTPIDRFARGTADYPDRSATLIVECATLAPEGARLTGPGIRDAAWLSLPETRAFADNHALYPRGLDFFFCAGTRLAALPRTAIVEAA